MAIWGYVWGIRFCGKSAGFAGIARGAVHTGGCSDVGSVAKNVLHVRVRVHYLLLLSGEMSRYTPKGLNNPARGNAPGIRLL